jgi:hypothetical protein
MNRFSIISIFAALIAAGSLGPECRAMSVVAPGFSSLVARSEQIVRAQATAVNSRWDATTQGPVIHTYVQFQVQRTIKGVAQDSVTLVLLGGQVGEDGMVIPDMPSFEVGSTYILFIAGNGRAFCPLVGVQHGSYRVVKDAATGAERVTRANGEALRSTADVVLPIESASPGPRPLGDALRREDFENAITQELAHPSQ